ncbi:MAG TPA: LUD domain-containing protein [Chryseosolibacter sp.]|nr:LUD domain-containing protein [Chryseosolibacter sp.]
MTSREKILAAVKKSQPPAPPSTPTRLDGALPVEAKTQFKEIVKAIGGSVIEIENTGQIAGHVGQKFPAEASILCSVPGAGIGTPPNDGVVFEKLNLVILRANFAVAENGAVWITDRLLPDRVLPFICEHLALVIDASDIVPTLTEAYEIIGSDQYHFGTFIAGPSKTADIEQSLVLGAHGPKSLTVFMLAEKN